MPAPSEDESAKGTIQVLWLVGCRDLHTDAGLPLGHYRIAEADHVDPFLEELCRHLLGQPGVTEHDGHDGMSPLPDLESPRRHGLAEIARVPLQPGLELRGRAQQIDRLQGGCHYSRSQGIGEKIGSASLPAEGDDRLAAAGEPAGGPPPSPYPR